MTSAFNENGYAATIDAAIQRTQDLYLEDSVPWVVGYSGGKDSTATLQLVWMALSRLKPDLRTKPVYVISTDTLVENPVVAAWVNHSLDVMQKSAAEQSLPIEPHRLTPTVDDSFWVNLIGRGYPAPRPKFRWCTERLKIKPSNEFIRQVVKSHGEAILVLGTRKAESQARAGRMEALESKRIRDGLSPNTSLPNSLVYSPLEDWSNDDVWVFLMQETNPWGYRNKDLLTMYQGATADGECPLVVDSSTPSCGDSRFGCWTCTLVDQDKSMSAMIANDEEKRWMTPMLEVRNALDFRNDNGHTDFELRDFRRMNGTVSVYQRKTDDNEERTDALIHGPYTQSARAEWLRKLLVAQAEARRFAPEELRGIELISQAELEEIRRIWVSEKHEIEDLLPEIVLECTGSEFVDSNHVTAPAIGSVELGLLRDICGEDELHYEMVRNLLDIERQNQMKIRRSGLFPAIEEEIARGFYEDEDDALSWAIRRREESQVPEVITIDPHVVMVNGPEGDA